MWREMTEEKAQQKIMKRDPVCGMQVDPASPRAKFEHGGRTYFFCCAGCAQKFEAAPEKYLQPRPTPAGPSLSVISTAPASRSVHAPATSIAPKPTGAAGSAEYTCSMHPEVVTRAPGDCPI